MKSFISHCRKSFPILLLFFITSFSFYFNFFLTGTKLFFFKNVYVQQSRAPSLIITLFNGCTVKTECEGDMFGINDANKLKLEWNSY